MHVLRCKATTAVETWDKGVIKLITLMSKSGVAPTIQQSITDGMNAWRNGQPTNDQGVCEEICKEALKTQYNIGWNNLMMGRVALDWTKVHKDQQSMATNC